MSKDKKDSTNALFELQNQANVLKSKRVAIQHQCNHKRGGKIMLKPTSDKFTFKCRKCKDKKVNLMALDTDRFGELVSQPKAVYRHLKSICDVLKIQSDKNDNDILKMLTQAENVTYSWAKITKKIIKNGMRRKSKKGNFNISVTSNGSALFGRRR